jgi:hypothetical protein
MTYKYWISGNDVAIFREGDVPEHGISLQDFKHPMLFWQNIEELYTFQKMYGLERLNFRPNCQVDSKKNTNLVENLKEMN